eukprot:gb/GFBE01074564.1/.p1 GENE.gb/GFBE01074564.1/~~gb/GFBE01074564.1/.p1  ORF type:complete len:255 (+),score=63.99 gb/GFBE01074564.1/:1-765(+)
MPKAPVHGGSAAVATRLYVFDFDQTLTVFHVFKSLSGWKGEYPVRIPGPYAMTETGQVERIQALSRDVFRQAGGFASIAFGGPERIEEVRSMLSLLKSNGADVMICTKGLVGPVQLCLHELDLLQYFSQVYGHVGDSYGTTEYDQKVELEASASSSKFLGRKEQASWGSKDRLMMQLMEKQGLSCLEAVLVEDDPEEIRRASKVCRTFFVREAKGLSKEHMATLKEMSRPHVVSQRGVVGVGAVKDSRRRCTVM